MGRLRIVAAGNSPQDQAQARGKLFEKLMSEVLRSSGFEIDTPSNVNYAGMELDIEGRHSLTGLSCYAECTCWDTEIDSPKFQSFFGKYFSKWLQDNRYMGIFIGLPGLNSHAKGFYKEYCQPKTQITVRVMEEPQVLDSIFSTAGIRPETVQAAIPPETGKPGEWTLLYSERGLYWVVYVILPGGTVPAGVVFLDRDGRVVTDKGSLEYFDEVCPDLREFRKVLLQESPRPDVTELSAEEVVEVRGSSEPFEYQFPASPAHFVGRRAILDEISSYVAKVAASATSSRGLLLEANSGWGKSSVVLAAVESITKEGNLAIAIDSRSASSSQFILRVINYVTSRLGSELSGSGSSESLTLLEGFESASQRLLDIDRALKERRRMLVIFLDQFENLFFMPEALKRIRDVLLRLCDAQTNIVLGFSWKTDLVGVTSEFPFRLRDDISTSSERIALERFSRDETTALLQKLSEELRAPLRKDLTFFLSEFSQGYPWLLKKLCAHVRSQRQAGQTQAQIANGLLNVEQLFSDDMKGLSLEEEDALKRIAKVAPVGVPELGERFKAEVIQSLVNQRFLVRIGNKYDIYWDIFRDYLNTGQLPIQENYIMRQQVRTVLEPARILAVAGGSLPVGTFQAQAGLRGNSYYNVVRDMKLIGIALAAEGRIRLVQDLPRDAESFGNALREHLKVRLPRNRIVFGLLQALEAKQLISIGDAAEILARLCPYISASAETWEYYARIMADWAYAADLAVFDGKQLIRVDPGTRLFDRRVLLARRRPVYILPSLHYEQMEHVIARVDEAVRLKTRVDWAGFSKTTVSNAFRTLEDLGFVRRQAKSIFVTARLTEFARNPDRRREIFAECAMRIRTFKEFMQMLQEQPSRDKTYRDLARDLQSRLHTNWETSTVETATKVMLNWARHTGLAPASGFGKGLRGERRTAPSRLQTSLPT